MMHHASEGSEDDNGREGAPDPSRPPEGVKVTFRPNDPREKAGDRSARSEAKRRADVLFGSVSVIDPFPPTRKVPREGCDKFFGSFDQIPIPAVPFKIAPSAFLRRATAMQPTDPEPTASAFSQWVYSLYSDARGSEEDKEDGLALEVQFGRERTGSLFNDYDPLRRLGSEWALIHNGLHLTTSNNRFKTINHLAVSGQPLRVSPDLMFRHRRTSEIIIVELKHSRLPITTNLWPNVWAQLWCYAQLEVVRAAPNVMVVGEVWMRHWVGGYGRGRKRVNGTPMLSLRASVRRDPRTPVYDRFFRRLFNIYRGLGPEG